MQILLSFFQNVTGLPIVSLALNWKLSDNERKSEKANDRSSDESTVILCVSWESEGKKGEKEGRKERKKRNREGREIRFEERSTRYLYNAFQTKVDRSNYEDVPRSTKHYYYYYYHYYY